MKTKNGVLVNTPEKILFSKNSSLSITALGGLSIQLDGKPIPALHSRKAQALLIYLAVTGRPQQREILADLLWEDFSRQKAMNNLRVVLSNLRKHLGNQLLITRDTAAMNPEVEYDLDVTALDAHLSFAGELERKTGVLNQEAIPWIKQAVNLYKGDFLAGFFIVQAPEFEAWVVVERERLHHLVLDGLGKLVRWELRRGDYTAGIRNASKWVQMEPFSEAAHRQMMRLLVFSGERGAALIQYDKCQEILANELGVAPDPKTTTLYEQIRDGVIALGETVPQHLPAAESTQADVHRHNLPIQTTPFVGREIELANLNQLLTNPNVRLVTVLGAGGMGKTRLALEIGDELLDQFPHGVFFVSLAPLQSKELIAPSIVQALGIEFAGGGASPTYLKETLLRNIRRKQLLLILDNFEHLLDGASLVGEIMQTAPGVKILATSRARLNISGEYRFQVAGMNYPEENQDKEAQKYSAVRFFLESAYRTRSGYRLRSDELEHIVNICRLLDGMPLGIRLAAAWMEILSPKEIAAEIVQSLDLLETELRDIPERHRSIRALFDHSWRLLSAREQDVFQSISVFQGGCTREAAQEITGATLRDLISLVDKSLLHRTLNGRYEIHELSKEYAAEKLGKNLESRDIVHNRHSAYYCDRVREWGDDLKSERQETALVEMDLEIENSRAAWNWAVDQHRLDLLDQSMEGFRHYFAIRDLVQEAEKTFHGASERFKFGSSEEGLRVYARFLSMQGYFTYRHKSDRKQDLYQRSLNVLENLEGLGQEVRFEKAQVLNFMGKIAARRDLVESLRLHKQSLGLFKALGDRYWESDTLMEIGRNFHLWGRVKKAQEYLQRSLANFRELGDSRKIAENLLIFDWFFQRQGKFKEAERAARERLALFEMIGDRSAIADGQAELAGCLGALGDFYEAVRLAEKAIEIHQELEYFTEFFQDTKCLCFNMLDLGNYQQASDLARHALEWCGGRFSTISDRLEGDSEMRRIGIALTFQGMAMLALGNLSKAELFLQQSQTALKDVPPESVTLLHHSSLGIASLKSNKPDRSKVHILNGLLKGMEIKSAIVLLYAISCAALFLANQGDLERAVEIYALAKRYPWIAKSQWYQDVIEAPLNTLTDSLLPEVIATAQQRGRERDLEETVQELITELA